MTKSAARQRQIEAQRFERGVHSRTVDDDGKLICRSRSKLFVIRLPLWLMIPFFVAVILSIFTYYRTDGFSLSKIDGPLQAGNADRISIECQKVLQQPYYYLAKGRQCFVFESEDHQIVIKFLNYDRFTLPYYLKMLPLPSKWRNQMSEWENRRFTRFDAIIQSYELAMQKMPDETGLIYLHFQKGEKLPKIQLMDRAHRNYQIDLSHTAFIVQKSAHMIFDELEYRWKTNGTLGLNQGIEAFIHFLNHRMNLQIADDDRDVGINFGFNKDRLILLDPGRLYINRQLGTVESKQREIKIASKRLRKWLIKNHPESVAFLDDLIRVQ